VTAKHCGQCGAELLGGVYSACYECDIKLCRRTVSPACHDAHAHTYEQRQPIMAARRYVGAIRNQAKQAYAREVQRAMCTGHPVPSAPPGLSVMAAQAVTMRLREILAEPVGAAPQ
jgi:hypothetical protein